MRRGDEVEDNFLLRRTFLTSTAIGFVDYENLNKNKLKVFIDLSLLGLSALVTQTQLFLEEGQMLEK